MCATQGRVGAPSDWRRKDTPEPCSGMCYFWGLVQIRSGTGAGLSQEFNLSRTAPTYPSRACSMYSRPVPMMNGVGVNGRTFPLEPRTKGPL